MMYFRGSTGSFYDTTFHGERSVLVVDPDWVRPEVEVPDPEWVRPEIEVPDPAWVPPEDDPEAIAPMIIVPDMDAVQPMILEPDMSVSPPMISVDNPDCKIPPDVVEISDEHYQALLHGRSNGMLIQADDDGMPVLVERPPSPASVRRVLAKRMVDSAAGKTRARYVSAGQLIEEEYRLALQQTQQWRAVGNPADAVPQAIQDWADAANITAEEAAVSIEQTDAAWQQVLLNIRQARLAGKAAIDSAPDDADFTAIAQPYIDQLAAMQP